MNFEISIVSLPVAIWRDICGNDYSSDLLKNEEKMQHAYVFLKYNVLLEMLLYSEVYLLQQNVCVCMRWVFVSDQIFSTSTGIATVPT